MTYRAVAFSLCAGLAVLAVQGAGTDSKGAKIALDAKGYTNSLIDPVYHPYAHGCRGALYRTSFSYWTADGKTGHGCVREDAFRKPKIVFDRVPR